MINRENYTWLTRPLGRLFSRAFVKWFFGLFILLWLLLYFTHRRPLFNDPVSAVLFDREGHFLSGRIAADGQWRFPEGHSLSEKYVKALLLFEDKRFYYHPGLDPLALARALAQNFRAGKVVSGGSTITTQLIRLSRKGRPRTVSEKLVEFWQALALETRFSKKKILHLYAAHAPFGSNVVGCETAAWRWFGHSSDDLSWAEAATLAILPNAPSMISPQQNRDALLRKRNSLLYRLYHTGEIDHITLQLALNEPLPTSPLPLPDLAPHYLEFLRKKSGDRLFESSIDQNLQQNIANLMVQHHQALKSNDIRHLAVILRDLTTGQVLAYHGNVPSNNSLNGVYNDMVQASRSSGSILKPFLYAASLDEGLITPQSLLPDVPTWMAGFHPQNFDESYSGAIEASKALQRSLNVPFVHLLHQYSIGRFHQLLRDLGFSTFTQEAAHYGLSLILGGGEVTLWELSEVYARFARQLIRQEVKDDFPLSKGSIFLTTDALRQLNRPETESGWHFREDRLQMAWKTGTSYGFRDAWAVGYTPDYCIAIWAGNADGHGRPGLTGISAAAPLLFDIALTLNTGRWFIAPLTELEEREMCRASGFPPGPFCDSLSSQLCLLHTRNEVPSCRFHQMVRTDVQERVTFPSGCQAPDSVVTRSWFLLPPVMAYYFQQKHSDYRPQPPVYKYCSTSQSVMEFVYPPDEAIIYQPATYTGNLNPTVFELVHQDYEAKVYWHLDEKYIGMTQGGRHQMPVRELQAGTHSLVVVDGSGNRKQRIFQLEKR